jgi:hypothetical protein
LITELAAKAGQTAASGGSHKEWGTHNALLGLEQGSYLELIAPEGGKDGPWAQRFRGLRRPALQAWCLRGGAADELAERIAAAGLEPKRVRGQRALPGGGQLRWELLFPLGHDYGGLMPFFIDWRDSPHPASRLPARLWLSQLRLLHPEPGPLRQLLGRFGALPGRVQVVGARLPALWAELGTPQGSIVLQGGVASADYLGDA